MDRREAIQELKQWRDQMKSHGVPNYGKKLTALNLAIEALEALDDAKSATTTDLISREAAIEAVESRQTEQWIESDIDYNSGLESALCEIKALPSAEAADVVRCKDCRYRELGGDVTHYYWCRINERPVDDTDYCAWGVESEVEE